MSNDIARYFVVFTTQRNGSTWLMSVLNGLDNVSAHGELFLGRPRSPDRRWDSDFAYPRYIETRRPRAIRPFSVFGYLNGLYASPGSVGFKLMYSQALAYPEIVPYLMRRRIRVVHLVRRNHLDVLISFELKRAIGKAHILSPNDRPRNLAVEIDTTSLLRDLRRLQLKHSVGRHVLRLSGLRHIEVAYEDLVTDPTRFADVLEFLSIQPPDTLPRSNILKSRGGSQREAVRNYDAVRRVLERSDFAGLLE